jgi:uncharacterized membrane protein
MTPEQMAFYSGAASGVLSLIFNWTPRLRQRFDRLTSENQQLFMAVSTFLIAAAINIYQCLDPESNVCENRSILQNVGVLAATFISGAVTNQGIDRITPKPQEVRQRRAARKKKVISRL